MITLEQQLEAILFYTTEPLTSAQLAQLLEVTLDEVAGAAAHLHAGLEKRGIQLLVAGDTYELVTVPAASEVIGRVKKDQLQRDLGKAGSETLAVVLYRGPVSRADIEYIRGVNCSVVLRNLLVRGLVERISHPNNARAVLYQPSTALLKDLGVTTIQELPEYEKTRTELDAFASTQGTTPQAPHAQQTQQTTAT